MSENGICCGIYRPQGFEIYGQNFGFDKKTKQSMFFLSSETAITYFSLTLTSGSQPCTILVPQRTFSNV